MATTATRTDELLLLGDHAEGETQLFEEDAACQPDIVLPWARGEVRQPMPAERLIAAVLVQGLIDHAAGIEDAEHWVALSERTPFAFEWICTELGLEAGYLRMQVHRLRRMRMHR